MTLTHKGCGGLVILMYEWKPTSYEREDGSTEWFPPLICQKCGQEITGDPQLAGPEDDDWPR